MVIHIPYELLTPYWETPLDILWTLTQTQGLAHIIPVSCGVEQKEDFCARGMLGLIKPVPRRIFDMFPGTHTTQNLDLCMKMEQY